MTTSAPYRGIGGIPNPEGVVEGRPVLHSHLCVCVLQQAHQQYDCHPESMFQTASGKVHRNSVSICAWASTKALANERQTRKLWFWINKTLACPEGIEPPTLSLEG